MSSVAPAVEPAGPARTSGLSAIFEHTRYVLGENRVTAFAFGLLIVIVVAALFGPYVVPYNPLASDTAAALKPPSAAHWFGTDQLGRDRDAVNTAVVLWPGNVHGSILPLGGDVHACLLRSYCHAC